MCEVFVFIRPYATSLVLPLIQILAECRTSYCSCCCSLVCEGKFPFEVLGGIQTWVEAFLLRTFLRERGWGHSQDGEVLKMGALYLESHNFTGSSRLILLF